MHPRVSPIATSARGSAIAIAAIAAWPPPLLLLLSLLATMRGVGAWWLWPPSSDSPAIARGTGETPATAHSHDGAAGVWQTVEPGRFFTANALTLLQELQTTSDPCLLAAFARMQVSCSSLQPTERARLALAWLNCNRQDTALPRILCADDTPLDACLRPLDKDDFTQYQQLYLKVLDVCSVLANDVFRAQVQGAVSKLQQAMIAAHAVADDTAQRIVSLNASAQALLGEQQAALDRLRDASDAAIDNITETSARVLRDVGAAAERAHANVNTAHEHTSALIELVDARGAQMASRLADDAARIAGMLGGVELAVNRSSHMLLARQHELHAGLSDLIDAQHVLGSAQMEQEQTLAQIGHHLVQIKNSTNAMTSALGAAAAAAKTVVRTAQALTAIVGAWLAATTILRMSAARMLWPAHVIAIAATCIEIAGALAYNDIVNASDAAELARARLAVRVTGLLGLVLLVLDSVLRVCAWRSRDQAALEPAAAAMIAIAPEPEYHRQQHRLPTQLLIDYIVALRVYGPRAPLPLELVSVLSQAPPSYYVARDADGDETLCAL